MSFLLVSNWAPRLSYCSGHPCAERIGSVPFLQLGNWNLTVVLLRQPIPQKVSLLQVQDRRPRLERQNMAYSQDGQCIYCYIIVNGFVTPFTVCIKDSTFDTLRTTPERYKILNSKLHQSTSPSCKSSRTLLRVQYSLKCLMISNDCHSFALSVASW